VFGSVAAAALWLFAYAFVVIRFAPQMARAVPFTSTILYALAYGACIGALPPFRIRKERGRKM
jgi:Na+/H+ antiporter NhaD/arsenite permease-like protein